MHLIHLALTNFRTYARLELDLSPGVTLLQGNNASGKTSLLESIFYLATARSPHAGTDRELIRWGASDEPLPFARVEAVVEKQGDVRARLEIVLVQPAQDEREQAREGARRSPGDDGHTNNRVSKRIKVNGVSRRAIDLLGELNAVLFLPEDLELVFGSPGERRRYLDTTLSQIDRRYGRALSRHNPIVEQRNSLLRDFRERAFRPDELAIWDRQLIDEGSYLIVRRADAVRRYNRLVRELHPRLTDGAETLDLVYQPSVLIAPPGPEREAAGAASPAEISERTQDIAARFERQIDSLRDRERRAALTLVGPHRDELRFLVQSR
ncbi:MAG: AAA family ATPase, partial [Chloroflexi bacterium]|nr:AAA family ATPase [Chloroflexota bacterium]